MIEIKQKKDCCGCWVCKNICPKQCIEMKEDEEGFLYPYVIKDICIDCGLCEKACPLQKPQIDEDKKPLGYAVQNKDANILRNSTSGGFYSAMSKYVIERCGLVFGAAFDDDMVLCHQSAEKIEDCKKFRGSKYLQSMIGSAYNEAKHALNEGRLVVFSGTGCQIAGLYSILQDKHPDNLITVDLVCHGVSSPKLFHRLIDFESIKNGSKVVDYRSRDKFYGYDFSSATIKFENSHIEYHKNIENDILLGAYFKGLCSRPSCYDCHFRTVNRVSDFTIFDCWNAPSISYKLTRKGATNVFIHTEKGQRVFDEIKDNFVYAESDVDKIVASDGIMMRQQPPKSPRRSEFFKDLNSGMSITDIQNKYNKRNLIKRAFVKVKPLLYKIGIWSIYMRMK